MKKDKKREQTPKASKSRPSNLKSFLLITLTLAVVLLAFLFSSMEPEELEAISLKFSEFIKMFYQLSKKAFLKDASLPQSPKPSLSSINFASFDRGSSIINVSKEIKASSALLKNNFASLLFPMKIIKRKPLEFVISGIEDFYLKEVVFKSNDFYTNFPRHIKIFTSIENTKRNWAFQGQVTLKDKNGFSTFKLRKMTLCRFVRFVILNCHDNFNFYYCSLNHLKLKGLTISAYKLSLGKEREIREISSCAGSSFFGYSGRGSDMVNVCDSGDVVRRRMYYIDARIAQVEERVDQGVRKIENFIKKFETFFTRKKKRRRPSKTKKLQKS